MGVSRSTPMAERWTKRRISVRSQAGDQGGKAVLMNRLHGIAGAILQHAGTIDDGLDAGQMGEPCIGRGGIAQVEPDPADLRQTPPCLGDVARNASDVMALRDQPGDDRAADQPGCPGNENPQPPPPSLVSHPAGQDSDRDLRA